MIRLPDATVRDLIDALRRSDELTGGYPVLSPDLIGTARTYLEQLLLDSGDRLHQHIATLENLYGGRFVAPLPRSWRHGMDVPPPQPPPEFRHSAVLPEPMALVVAEGGVDQLPASALASLLLNPCGLWDLSDLINTLWPDYWIDRMNEVGVQLARETGIDLYKDFETIVGALPPTDRKEAAG